MLDTVVRPLINQPLDSIGRVLAQRGVTANTVTFIGLVIGVAAAAAIASAHFLTGLVLIVVNRLVDGLDGAVARATEPSDVGGYLDIVADYVFYSAVPLAFALADPGGNALAAAALLAAFCLTCSSFLTFAVIAEKRAMRTESHGRKSFFYSTGIVEGTETIAFLIAMAAMPGWFSSLAWGLAGLCVLTVVQRSMQAIAQFR